MTKPIDTLGNALLEQGKRAQAATARLAEAIPVPAKGKALPPVAYEPDFVDVPKSTIGPRAWLRALASLRPRFHPFGYWLEDAAKNLVGVNDGIARFEAGERSAPNLISDPFQYTLVMMRCLEISRKALRGTTGEGIITKAHIRKLHEYLRPHADAYLSRALSWVEREDELTQLLRDHQAKGFNPDSDDLSLHLFLVRATEAYEAALAAPPEVRISKLTKLRARLMDAFKREKVTKVYDGLPEEAKLRLFEWTNVLAYLEETTRAFPDSALGAIQAATSTA